jgi:hypothetical protein
MQNIVTRERGVFESVDSCEMTEIASSHRLITCDRRAIMNITRAREILTSVRSPIPIHRPLLLLCAAIPGNHTAEDPTFCNTAQSMRCYAKAAGYHGDGIHFALLGPRCLHGDGI